MRRESDQALLDAFETDREANERLKQLERVRSEMASTVSHELRTPLTSAAGYVELLVEGDAGPLTDEQRDMLDTVARSLSRLDGIVDDVLGMASPASTGRSIRDRPISRRSCSRRSTRSHCRQRPADRTSYVSTSSPARKWRPTLGGSSARSSTCSPTR